MSLRLFSRGIDRDKKTKDDSMSNMMGRTV